jgi:hypothetical protein
MLDIIQTKSFVEKLAEYIKFEKRRFEVKNGHTIFDKPHKNLGWGIKNAFVQALKDFMPNATINSILGNNMGDVVEVDGVPLCLRSRWNAKEEYPSVITFQKTYTMDEMVKLYGLLNTKQIKEVIMKKDDFKIDTKFIIYLTYDPYNVNKVSLSVIENREEYSYVYAYAGTSLRKEARILGSTIKELVDGSTINALNDSEIDLMDYQQYKKRKKIA